MKLLTVPQASKEYGIPYQTLLRLIHQKELIAVKLPGRRSFLLDPIDIEAMLNAAKTGSFDGSKGPNDIGQVALNKESQIQARPRSNRAKSSFDHVFERSGKSCS
jgi:excisionase family DNA binding protein